jgi:RNA polymerase subunit RPABC4/transcription elongation factor Spt4
MNNTLIAVGVTLLVIGAIFTFITFGFGIICSWPLLLVGFILLIVGVVIPNEQTSAPNCYSSQERRCPQCGRVIPFDSVTCPYCQKKFTSEPQPKTSTICKYCGAPVPETMKYCGTCGKKLKNE